LLCVCGGGGAAAWQPPLYAPMCMCVYVYVCVCVCVCVHDSFDDITSISDYSPVVPKGTTFSERRTGTNKFKRRCRGLLGALPALPGISKGRYKNCQTM
jgi:hypothetical protein